MKLIALKVHGCEITSAVSKMEIHVGKTAPNKIKIVSANNEALDDF